MEPGWGLDAAISLQPPLQRSSPPCVLCAHLRVRRGGRPCEVVGVHAPREGLRPGASLQGVATVVGAQDEEVLLNLRCGGEAGAERACGAGALQRERVERPSCFEGCLVSDWVRLRRVTEEKADDSRCSSNGRPPTRPEWGPRRAVTALDGEAVRWGREIAS